MNITVEVKEDYTDCPHAGCSGGELYEITATRGDKSVTVSGGGCFGMDWAATIAELMNKWEKPNDQ